MLIIAPNGEPVEVGDLEELYQLIDKWGNSYLGWGCSLEVGTDEVGPNKTRAIVFREVDNTSHMGEEL